MASTFGARPREVVFTSSATEAIATVARGVAGRGRHQVVSAVEHSAVRLAAEQAGEVTVVAVDRHGRVDPDEVVAAMRPDTAVVHVQAATTRSGRPSPWPRSSRPAPGSTCSSTSTPPRPTATFRSTSPTLGADLLSLSAHKFGGPAGVGALLVRRGLRLDPLLVGGDQERARRAGLENVGAVAGFAAACGALAGGGLEAEATEARRLTDRVLDGVAGLDGIPIYGDPVDRLPHLVCLGIEGVEPQAVLLGLDAGGDRRALGQRLLVRGPRAVTGPRGDGRRRPPLPPGLGGLVQHRRRTSTPSSPRSPGSSSDLRALGAG